MIKYILTTSVKRIEKKTLTIPAGDGGGECVSVRFSGKRKTRFAARFNDPLQTNDRASRYRVHSTVMGRFNSFSPFPFNVYTIKSERFHFTSKSFAPDPAIECPIHCIN